MSSRIPNIDSSAHGQDALITGTTSVEEKHEFQLLKHENQFREIGIRSAKQMYRIRWTAIGISSLLLLGMTVLLAIAVRKLFFVESSTLPVSLQVTAYLTPIVTMSAISIAVLVAAFRGYHESDKNTAARLSEAAAKGTISMT